MADSGSPEVLQWEDDGGTLNAVAVDLVVNHDDERSAEVTSNPVEKGADINDHVIQLPDVLRLEIAQTNTPFPSPPRPGVYWAKPEGLTHRTVKLDVRKSLFTPGGLFFLSQAAGNALASATAALGLTSSSDDVKVLVWTSETPRDRIGELHDQLIDVKQRARFVTVTFRGRVYPGYILKKVTWSSRPGEVGLGRFQLELQSIRIVQNAVAELPDPSSLRLKPVKSTAKPPKPVEDPAPDAGKNPLESLASKALGGAGA